MRPLALLLLTSFAAPALAGDWVDRAPVVSAVPVYRTQPACHPDSLRAIGGADLIESLRADLERARCESAPREISGWSVTYRYGGREYTRLFAEPPGRFVEVEVNVAPAAGPGGAFR